MQDVLEVARERQTELRTEIADIDAFIRMAESLLRTAKSGSAGRAEASVGEPEGSGSTRLERSGAARLFRKAETVDEAETAGDDEEPLRLDTPQVVDMPDPEVGPAPEPAARSFPWSNPHPHVRKADGSEEGVRTRHNLMRREAS